MLFFRIYAIKSLLVDSPSSRPYHPYLKSNICYRLPAPRAMRPSSKSETPDKGWKFGGRRICQSRLVLLSNIGSFGWETLHAVWIKWSVAVLVASSVLNTDTETTFVQNQNHGENDKKETNPPL